MRIRKEDIPGYLHSSLFYNTLSDTDADLEQYGQELEIPEELLKLDTNIASLADVKHLLETHRFWGYSGEAFDGILDFCLYKRFNTNPVTFSADILELLTEFKRELPYLEAIMQLLLCQNQSHMHPTRRDYALSMMQTAVRSSSLVVVKYVQQLLLQQRQDVIMDRLVIKEAVKIGFLELLQYIQSSVESKDKPMRHLLIANPSYAESSAAHGHVHCLEYLMQLQPRYRTAVALRCWMKAAARRGHAHCLKFLCALDSDRDYLNNNNAAHNLTCAVSSGNVDCVQFVLQHMVAEGIASRTRSAITTAVELGHLEVLQLLIRSGFRNGSNVFTACERAAQCGQLQCLHCLVENGFVLQPRCAIDAARNGHADCLRFVLQQLPEPPANLCGVAASHGHLDCLLIAYGADFKATATATATFVPLSMLCTQAAGGGNLDCLKFVHEVMGCQMASRVYDVAAARGRVDMIDYALKRGVAKSRTATAAAAEHSKLLALQRLHESGFPWDPRTCSKALRSNATATAAAESLQLPCFLYAYRHGCSSDSVLWHPLAAYLCSIEFLYSHFGCCDWSCGWESTNATVSTASTAAGGFWAQQHSTKWHLAHALLAAAACALPIFYCVQIVLKWFFVVAVV